MQLACKSSDIIYLCFAFYITKTSRIWQGCDISHWGWQKPISLVISSFTFTKINVTSLSDASEEHTFVAISGLAVSGKTWNNNSSSVTKLGRQRTSTELRNSLLGRCRSDRKLRTGPLGRLGTGRHFSLGLLTTRTGDGSGRQIREHGWTQNSVLGIYKLSAGKTGMKHSLSKLIVASSVLVEGVGLHVIPSYTTSESTRTRDVPGWCTWSDQVRHCWLKLWGHLWFCLSLRLFYRGRLRLMVCRKAQEEGTVVEVYPLERPFRFVSRQVHLGHVNTHTHIFGLTEHKKINKSNSLIKKKPQNNKIRGIQEL